MRDLKSPISHHVYEAPTVPTLEHQVKNVFMVMEGGLARLQLHYGKQSHMRT
jgi:hypothetical protein